MGLLIASPFTLPGVLIFSFHFFTHQPAALVEASILPEVQALPLGHAAGPLALVGVPIGEVSDPALEQGCAAWGGFPAAQLPPTRAGPCAVDAGHVVAGFCWQTADFMQVGGFSGT